VPWSAAADVAIGLMFAYLVFSLAASRVNEIVAAKLQWRAQGLERGLRAMLGGPPISAESLPGVQADGVAPAPNEQLGGGTLTALDVRQHPVVAALDAGLKKGRRISYLPARTFSSAVLDLLVPVLDMAAPPAALLLRDVDQSALTPEGRSAFAALQARPERQQIDAFAAALTPQDAHNQAVAQQLRLALGADFVERARSAVLGLGEHHPARRTLLSMIDDAEGDRDRLRSQLERWYDDEMDRVSGWYRRRVQLWIAVYGTVLTIVFNVDSIGIAQDLWRSPVERSAVSSAAAGQKNVADVDSSLDAIRSLSLPLGWTAPHSGAHSGQASHDPRHFPASVGEYVLKILGLVATILALTMGAPFWFDALGKLGRLRNAGNTPPKAS
jgi:hypothetical protein